jgi:hypothetical protein
MPLTGLFSIAYLPPVSYLQQCLVSEDVCIEQHEHYEKQSYRNRCYILGPNGKQALIIPVEHKALFRTPLRDVRIAGDPRWKTIHWKAICTAYRNAPYFEYYAEELYSVFSIPEGNLFQFNLALLKKLFELFRIDKSPTLTVEYVPHPGPASDFRAAFHPKKTCVATKPYRQVFSDKHGFQNDLSAIDYLFNAGPGLADSL